MAEDRRPDSLYCTGHLLGVCVTDISKAVRHVQHLSVDQKIIHNDVSFSFSATNGSDTLTDKTL